ncbi:MAG TPA: zinc ribbon domain-containing protein, partial [Dehalococcoidales bacterium]|nr:zinc ribbon domain-containing protein [Dehalococcoidales bacterium]
MIGITAYGAYIPVRRLGQGTRGWTQVREKTVANWDEDSLTMAVAAAKNCLGNTERRRIDALYCASASAPYKEKMMSTLAAWAIDLEPETTTLDIANSLRCGTSAVRQAIDSVKAGTYSHILVTASDLRAGSPRSGLDNGLGEAAAALVIGKENPLAALIASSSTSNEILDVWRADRSRYVQSWEDRFVYEEGYFSTVRQAVTQFLTKHNLDLETVSKVALYAPDERRHRELTASLGIKPAQIQDPLFNQIGDTGCSLSLVLLLHALEKAEEGDLILSIGYGNGTDISLWQATSNISDFRPKYTIDQLLSTKYYVPLIEDYLAFREFAVKDPDSGGSASASLIWREREAIYRLRGVRCRHCGTAQFPPQRVCTLCQSKDNFDSIRFSDKMGTVFTYTLKNGFDIPSFARPMVDTMVDFEGGGRAIFGMTDADVKDIRIGMKVEMNFRTL